MVQLRVRDLMTTQVITVKPTDTVRQAVIKMALDNVTGAPVVDNRNHVLGVISQTDILQLILKYQDKLDEEIHSEHLLSQPMDTDNQSADMTLINKEFSGMKVEDIMVRSTLYTTPDAEIVEALRMMMKMDVNRLPVLEQGILVGTVSRSDVIFAIYKKKV
ncbi:CBS domain-containing protein [Methanomethylophilus alvi]|jgi:CBS domain-containing protein|nr:CBS domain-containing protein [Methanomethylophilus alvi]MDY7060016.1 CBS domain-containing protein [Methanomethylophilus alvi]CDF31137.1 cBS domain containing protein [Methanoculleus sp. CAG:1088]